MPPVLLFWSKSDSLPIDPFENAIFYRDFIISVNYNIWNFIFKCTEYDDGIALGSTDILKNILSSNH